MKNDNQIQRDILPFIAGYFSEAVSDDSSGNKRFEDVLRKSPPYVFLWKEIFALSFRIFKEEFELDTNELNSNETIDYENKWNEFLELRKSFNEWFPVIHKQWVEDRAWISHPDTHGPDESLAHLVCGAFHRKFKDFLWADKYKNEIKEMFQQYVSNS